MRNYYQRHRKRRRERIGFYTALSICLIAVCLAVYSTYNTVTGPSVTQKSKISQQVNQPVTGIRATPPAPTIGFPTAAEEEPETEAEYDNSALTVAETTEPKETTAPFTFSNDALQTMLAADISLSAPVRNGVIIREYSKDSVYNKTLNVWKPHCGIDISGDLGDPVYSMTVGEVTKVTDDKLLGKTVEISVNNILCSYSGLGDVKVKEGEKVKAGDTIGTLGAVPCEAAERNHIHVAVKVNNQYADPLSFIDNKE